MASSIANMKKLLLLLVSLTTTTSLHLRTQAESGPADPSSSGPAPPASEGLASSGPAAPATNGDGSNFAATLLKLADHMDGNGASGPDGAKHQQFAEAVVKASKIVGTHHATKVTLQQVVEALSKVKKKTDAPKKLPIKEIVNALRLPPLKPKKKKPDLKKLLGTAVDAVEKKLDQLETVLNQPGSEEEEEETASVVEKSVEELSASDIIKGLNKLHPDKMPKPFLVVKPRPGSPIP